MTEHMSLQQAKDLIIAVHNNPGHPARNPEKNPALFASWLQKKHEAYRIVQQEDPEWMTPCEAAREDLEQEPLIAFEARLDPRFKPVSIEAPTAGPNDPPPPDITFGDLRERRVFEIRRDTEEG